MDVEDIAHVVAGLRQTVQAHPHEPDVAATEFGWQELLDDEPEVAVGTWFSLAGELLTRGSLLHEVMLRSGVLTPDFDLCRVVLPPAGCHRIASRSTADGVVSVDGIVQAGSGPAIVPCVDSSGVVTFVYVESLVAHERGPLDSEALWAVVKGQVGVYGPIHVVDLGGDDPNRVWERMLAAGRRALSHELIAVGGAMLAMTVEHVCSRKQFGQALGSFQAVKHQLADVHLWQQVAELAVAASWESEGSESAALAKTTAIRFSRTARTHCQQLLGGMGFTWEHEFHAYLRRALTIEPLLGSAADIHAELGAALRSGVIDNTMVAL